MFYEKIMELIFELDLIIIARNLNCLSQNLRKPGVNKLEIWSSLDVQLNFASSSCDFRMLNCQNLSQKT
jgi:hypothetical protein